ncbi:DUF1289 domain-containing protein [Sneathiella chinensis]|uniref:DUF1289 domain-containing protein n=1 Tax=Sneathiella chinensis TaxID=349750 RepID=A0ABQ5U594_9PROT|nr:DUF1289 domain-containing protein [Sneathiella chinensis]GLQ07079.1 hypothetical protein GCM10007924_23000 [Sneathiella chinensis]
MHRTVIKQKNLNTDIPSPCTGICSMDDANLYCKGCFRNRLEIGGWSLMSSEEKLAVIKELRGRRRAAKENA